jgi:hypothetical protein
MLCQGVIASSGQDVAVQLADLRPHAQLDSSGDPGGVVLCCRGKWRINGMARHCRMRWTLQLDDDELVAAVAERSGRGELVLGVDL